MYPNFSKIPTHSLSKEQALVALQSDQMGLSDQERKSRFQEFGYNEIADKEKLSKLKIFLRQFQSPIIYILLVATAITLFLQDYKDALFIFAAALVNAVLGYYQEQRAESALEGLRKYIQEKAIVLIDGKEKEVSAKELVPGDIVRLRAGSKVPADARIIFENDLYANEAVLTGESLPQKKTTLQDQQDTALADRSAMVFAGSVITQGYANVAVVATGAQTEIGKIAHLVKNQKDEKTPLQNALYKFSLKASVAIFALSVGIFLVAINSGEPLLQAFLISVAVLVAAVPEGLPIVMTIILATGVQRLAKKNGVVRQLSAAETLGSTTVILTDKTGTLTQAKMKLATIRPFSKIKSELSDEQFILSLALLNADITIQNPGDDASMWQVAGKSLEVSLAKEAATNYEVFYPEVLSQKNEIDFLPFNSKNKFSSLKYKTSDTKITSAFSGKKTTTLITALGAPEILIKLCDYTQEEKEDLLTKVDTMAYNGERVVALAAAEVGPTSKRAAKDLASLKGLKLIGTISFKDPIKETVKDALEEVTQAGVKTVIVTGDHTGTAVSIAKELGMLIGEDSVLSGEILDTLSDEELSVRTKNLKIVSRVSPEGKMRLTQAFQANGEIVAMNGDGVNDAPAIKQADIGIAMGTGTDVAKQAADLVLLDDNFETIVEAIKEGHRIVQNMRKALIYLMSSILDEVLLIGAAILVGIPLPLSPLQILWKNFFADSFPGLALAFEHKIDKIESQPTKIKKGMFTNKMKILLFMNGTISSVLLIILYILLLQFGVEEALARTVTFAAFSSYTLFLAFSMRSLKKEIYKYNPFSNMPLNISFLIGVVLIAISIYVPFFQKLFNTVPLSGVWIVTVIAFGLLNIAAVEATKKLVQERF